MVKRTIGVIYSHKPVDSAIITRIGKGSAMRGMLLIKGLILIVLLTAIFLLPGCGDDSGDQAKSTDMPSVPLMEEGGEGSLSDRIDALKELEMTVEVIDNGKSVVIWSQKQGNWRWDDPQDKNTYVIHNASLNKTWSVTGETAVELSGSQLPQYMGMSPASMLGIYAALPATSRTDDTWELNLPGKGSIIIEFKGPEELPTRMTSTDATAGKTDVIEFKYSNVGAVPDSLFELPAGVQVQQAPAGGMEITVPEI